MSLAATACFLVSVLSAGQSGVPVDLGANLEGIADWSYSNAFADLVKQSRGFGLPDRPWDGKVAVDKDGWPTADFGIVLGSWTGMKSLGGTYKIQAQCATLPTISLVSSPGTIKNLKRDGNGLVTADLVYPAGGSQLMLAFTGTKGGVRQLKIMRPGYAPSAEFTTPFLNHLKRFSTLRFMDWASTNANPAINWADRTSPAAPYFANGNNVPWEVCIDLCNQLNKDAWINVPHMATSTYVSELAKLFHQRLKSSLHVYVEYSNEVWNWGFTQSHWNADQAKADVKAGDKDLNYDNVNDPNIWAARRIAKRIRTISTQFRKEFGDAAMNDQVRPVLATQYAWPSFWLQSALTFLNARFGPPNGYLYAVAGAPYFNLGDADKQTNLTKDDVLKALSDSAHSYGTDLNMDACVTLSRYYNLRFVAYEGGPDTFGPNNIAAKKAASLDPKFQPICEEYLHQWFGYGNALFNWFVAGATSYDGQYGSWGLTNDMTNQSAPKIKAVDAVRQAGTLPLTQGIALPSDAVDARKSAFRDANWSTQGLLSLSATDWRGPYRDYLVRSPKAATYTLKLLTATANAGVKIEMWVNNAKVGSQTLVASGADTFVPSTGVKATLPAGLSVVRLRIVAGNSATVKSFSLK